MGGEGTRRCEEENGNNTTAATTSTRWHHTRWTGVGVDERVDVGCVLLLVGREEGRPGLQMRLPLTLSVCIL